MSTSTTRRGFLRTGVGAALATGACRSEMPAERAADPTSMPPDAAAADRVRVDTTINGNAQTFEVGADDSALEAVRGIGLTGAKHGCGHGACGSCAMAIDDVPLATCLLPATALHGKRVRTIEGIGTGELHPIQRAFMAEDALQCGYCTPGFVVEAVAFHDRWVAAHGNTEPSRDEVADALAGHLCRCGSYAPILPAHARCTAR